MDTEHSHKSYTLSTHMNYTVNMASPDGPLIRNHHEWYKWIDIKLVTENYSVV